MAIPGSDCDKLLQNGLYQTYDIKKTDNFSLDFRKYLLSETFRSNLRDGKWGGSITVPIDGVPVTLGASADDTNISTFQEKIRNDTNFSMSSADYETIHSSVPNVDLANAYVKCVTDRDRIDSSKYGFKVETESDEGFATFKIEYTPYDADTPRPILQRCTIINGTDIISDVEPGTKIKQRHLVTCKRDKTKSLRLIFDTDRGAAIALIPADPAPTPEARPQEKTVPTLHIKSSGQLALVLNDPASGAGNVGSREWQVARGITVQETWYVIEENIVDLPKFDKILAHRHADNPDTVVVDFRGINQKAAIDIRLYAVYS